MPAYISNQTLYEDIDAVIDKLRSSGHMADAEKVNDLLHNVAWTTSSELHIQFDQILKSNQSLPPAIASDIKSLLSAIIKSAVVVNGGNFGEYHTHPGSLIIAA